MDIETKVRLDSLKTAAIVMNGMAEGIKDPETRDKTKSLAWSISWAVVRIASMEEVLFSIRPDKLIEVLGVEGDAEQISGCIAKNVAQHIKDLGIEILKANNVPFTIKE